MIEIKNLSKVYGKLTALSVDQLEINKGECFGLVGNNGAGKTTLFSLILDLIEATTGEVASNEHSVQGSEHWKKYTTAYLDEGFLIDFLTPEEYFEFIGELHEKSPKEIEELLKHYDTIFNGEVLGKKKYIRDLSKGNQKKVGIVGSLLSEPEIIILDEPFPNLDPSTVMRLKNVIKELNSKGVTILISSHDLNHVVDVCNRIVVLEGGKIIRDEPTTKETLSELEKYFAVE